MAHRVSQCAMHTQELLQELQRDKDFDLLRSYLIKFNLFPRKRDTATAPIRFEELKELVKYWKLHRQRNFWRNHTTKEDLVKTLHKHINTKILPGEQQQLGPGEPAIANPTRDTNFSSVAQPPNATQPSSFSPRKPKINEDPSTSNAFAAYKGDLFGQRGNYDDGMIYLSRMGLAGQDKEKERQKDVQLNQLDNNEQKDEEDDDSIVEKRENINAGFKREKMLKRECACSLYQLSLAPGNEKAMLVEGVMSAIVRLSIIDDVDIKRFCSGAIVNLTCDLTLCSRMIDEGLLVALSELSKSANEEIRQNSSIALCRASYDRQGQLRLVQEGGVSSMLSMLNSSDYLTREACIKALINISSFSGSSVADGVVHALIKIASKRNSIYQSFVALAIQSLSLLSGARVKVVDDGILEAIAELTKNSTDSTLHKQLATAVCNFSSLVSNHENMSQLCILDCIKTLLNNSTESVKEMCVVTMANLSSNPTAITNFVLSDMLRQLVQIGNNSNEIVQESISLCISNLAAIDENRPLLTREGAVGVLIGYFRNGNVITKQYAVIALCNLMVHPASRNEVIQQNIVGSLVSLSASSDEKIREICALAFYNLSCDDSLQGLILHDEAIAAIISLNKMSSVPADSKKRQIKKNVPPNSAKDSELSSTQENCLGSLYNLSFRKPRDLLALNGVVLMLYSMFQRPLKQEKYITQCAAIICNLTFEKSCRKRVVDDNGIKLLSNLMKVSSKNCLLCCSTALCNLSLEAIETPSFVSMLIALSNTSNTKVILNCAMAISKLASHTLHRQKLAENTELAPTLTVMMRSGVEDIQINAAVALCNLASQRGIQAIKVWKDGTVPDFIVNSLLRVNSDSTKEICARALFNLLAHYDCREVLINSGVLYALVKLARLESIEIREICATALYNLSCEDSMIDLLMKMKIVLVISKMCESEYNNQKIRHYLSACFNNIASRAGNENALIEGGSLDAVIILMSFDDGFVMKSCASLLNSLSFHEQSCLCMGIPSILQVLLTMVNSISAENYNLALGTLCNISQYPALQEAALEAHVIENVLEFLESNATKNSTLVCCKILCNMSCNDKNHSSMMKGNIISYLYKILSQNNMIEAEKVDIIKACTKVTVTLTDEEENWGAMIKAGAIQLISIAVAENEESIILDCITALCRLSRCSENSERLISDGIISILHKAVFSDIAKQNIELLTAISLMSSIIMRSLSTHKSCCKAIAEDEKTMDMISALAEIRDRETCKNCAFALYSISSIATNSISTMVERGVVPLLIKLSRGKNPDAKQVCAVSLAHIKSQGMIKEDDETTFIEGDDDNNIQGGLVTTLVSMLDMDHTIAQKVEKLSCVLPPIDLITDRSQWKFLKSNPQTLLKATINVSWEHRTSPMDESRYIPEEPEKYLSQLRSISAKAKSFVRDMAYGTFQILSVSNEKRKVKKIIVKTPQQRETAQNLLDQLVRLTPSTIYEDNPSKKVKDEEHIVEVRDPSPPKSSKSSKSRRKLSVTPKPKLSSKKRFQRGIREIVRSRGKTAEGSQKPKLIKQGSSTSVTLPKL